MPAASNANVQSLDAVRDVRQSLISFQERAESALEELRSKIDRTMAWLEQDRPNYWRDQERRAYDRVASTRVAYETCKMRTVGGRHPECIEERVAFQRAKERLEYCKVKIEVVRRWCVEASRQVDEYRGRCSPLKNQLDQEVPNAIAKLSRMIEALEAYADVRNAQSLETQQPVAPIDDKSIVDEPETLRPDTSDDAVQSAETDDVARNPSTMKEEI